MKRPDQIEGATMAVPWDKREEMMSKVLLEPHPDDPERKCVRVRCAPFMDGWAAIIPEYEPEEDCVLREIGERMREGITVEEIGRKVWQVICEATGRSAGEKECREEVMAIAQWHRKEIRAERRFARRCIARYFVLRGDRGESEGGRE